MTHIFLESHGVKLDVEVADESLVSRVRDILPPAWKPTREFPEDGHLTIASSRAGEFDVDVDGLPMATGVSADVALHVLDAQLRARIALHATEEVFVHAGVVGVDGRLLVVPGPSFSGKSALTAALVERGATYFSDEYAVLDPTGLVHPYPRALSLRPEDHRFGTPTTVEELGGQAAEGPGRIALIALTRYVPGAQWGPRRQGPGVGALGLLTNAVPARSRTTESMDVITRAVGNASVLEGPRGDAGYAADHLLEALRSA
jgi:hypothetical protein